LSSATASRDLKEGVENQIIEKSGDKKTTSTSENKKDSNFFF
jgi:Fic family protein